MKTRAVWVCGMPSAVLSISQTPIINIHSNVTAQVQVYCLKYKDSEAYRDEMMLLNVPKEKSAEQCL